jgi:anthranilate synthase component 1
LNDEKERAEHVMLVDLGRNDLGRVCQPGTVNVDSFMKIEKWVVSATNSPSDLVTG